MNEDMNQLVAEKALGWELLYTVGHPVPHTFAYKDQDGKTHRDFRPSTNIQDAWDALDAVCKKYNWRAIIDRNQQQTEVTFKSQMGGNTQKYGIAETPMMAICLAILETVGIESNQK